LLKRRLLLLIAITAATVINGIPNSKAILVFTHVNVIDVTRGGVQQEYDGGDQGKTNRRV